MVLDIDNVTYSIHSVADLESVKKASTSIDTVKDEVIEFCLEWFNDSDYINAFTSGSTGTPKEMRLGKEAVSASARKTAKFFDLKSGDVALLALPLKYIAGKIMLARALVLDLHLILKASSAMPMEGISSDIDFLPLTPHQALASLRRDPKCFNSVNKVLLGGGPVPRELKYIIKKSNILFFHGFGMTETITHIAVRTLNGPKSSEHYEALQGIRFEADKEDRLIIHADHLKDVIWTNDVIELIDEKTFRWIGRSDNVINSGGIKIYPEMLESRFESLFDQPFFIGGCNDDIYGEVPVLILEGTREDALEALNIIRVQSRFKYAIPKKAYVLDAFIYTSSDKIMRRETLNCALQTKPVF